MVLSLLNESNSFLIGEYRSPSFLRVDSGSDSFVRL